MLLWARRVALWFLLVKYIFHAWHHSDRWLLGHMSLWFGFKDIPALSLSRGLRFDNHATFEELIRTWHNLTLAFIQYYASLKIWDCWLLRMRLQRFCSVLELKFGSIDMCHLLLSVRDFLRWCHGFTKHKTLRKLLSARLPGIILIGLVNCLNFGFAYWTKVLMKSDGLARATSELFAHFTTIFVDILQKTLVI